jgi:tellurite resistance protein TerC
MNEPIIHTGTPLLYLSFSLLVVFFLVIDFFLLKTKGNHKVSTKEALGWSVVWFLAAGVFASWLYWYLSGVHGQDLARAKVLEFATGYILEKSLAIENVFVWITIFSYFGVPAIYQKRVLLWGVIGAIVLRAILIYLGAVLVQQFSWVFYVFGAFLVFTGIKMFWATGQTSDLNNNKLLNWLRGHLPITPEMEGDRFMVIKNGVRMLTPLFLVVVLVEISDVIFALDSIPAIFAVTSDPFIVFTANIFAILGLRAMYFLLADMADRFHLLGYGLAVIVTLVGVKMLLMDFYHVPTYIMLGCVALILAISVAGSLLTKQAKKTK